MTPFAYPVPLYSKPLGSDRLIFHGRSGGHSYMNVDGIVAASLALARQLNP